MHTLFMHAAMVVAMGASLLAATAQAAVAAGTDQDKPAAEATKGEIKSLAHKKQGWPDIAILGPGTCFAVWRWNASVDAVHKRSAL